ncbi:dihydrofolate reductase [Butyrivibrio sp. MC2013]|uniref:dihydrofolate reductase n=1 Tax=Butyrivibrio sp. MC2013 TaxID=1280686 RepID=UPI000417718B|nr:dihydrofolate reductase [Butyrivibrio sp. MC2013]
MKAIVLTDNNWAIGNKGQLLVTIPADHKMFRNETKDKVVILGRKTLATFPGGLPLAGRTNIILSRNPDFKVRSTETAEAIMASSIEDAIEKASAFDTNDIYVIGGEMIYRQMLPYVDTCIITRVDREYEADAFFPNLEEDPEWMMAEESEEQYYFDNCYTFQRWVRVN